MIGEHPNPEMKTNIKINDELVVRWQKLLQEGISEGEKKKYMDTYPRNTNLYTEAPKLNLEIKPLINDPTVKRDIHFTETQNCVGSAITAIGAAISMILEDPEDGIDQQVLMKYLCDSGKLMSESFYQLSNTRKIFINPSMSKTLKPTLDATKADTWLYGNKFVDQIRDSKEIEKACANIRTSNPSGSKTTFQGNLKYPPAKFKQVGNRNKRTVMNFKPKSELLPYNSQKSQPKNKSFNRYPPPRR